MKKYKILFLFIICLFLQVVSSAETLNCSIEKTWTIDTARAEAFKDMKSVLDLGWASPIDPNLIENKQALNNNLQFIKNRKITRFSYGYYGVKTADEDDFSKDYYYSSDGKLIAIGFSVFPPEIKNLQDFLSGSQNDQIYPVKIYKHAYPSGKIIAISLTVITPKGEENYIFKPSGELQAHWIGQDCYDVNGKKVLSRINPK